MFPHLVSQGCCGFGGTPGFQYYRSHTIAKNTKIIHITIDSHLNPKMCREYLRSSAIQVLTYTYATLHIPRISKASYPKPNSPHKPPMPLTRPDTPRTSYITNIN